MPPDTPKRQRTKQAVKSPYDSRSIIIAIGRQRRVFNVLESFLKNKTSFFNRHGAPPRLEEQAGTGGTSTADPGADINNVLDQNTDLDVKAEAGNANVPDTGETAAAAADHNAGQKMARVVPHYHIISKIHTSQAFQIFVDWLHNILPNAPEDKEDCKFLLQAYVLAVNYDAGQLQNAILDCFREYHAEVTVDLDHLVWMVNNTGDNTGLHMTAYLVQQIAYEIALHGVEKYENDNKYMPYYMREGDRFVRYELVKAIANRTTSAGRKAGNPATSDHNEWCVIVPDRRESR